MLKIVPSNRFKRDLKLAAKRHLNLALLNDVVTRLAREEILPPEFHDHNLTGNYAGFRECHIEPNWLLVYRVEAEQLELFLFSHGNSF